MTDVTCRLTAKNWDQLRNPTLGNQVWATFTFVTEGILACHRRVGMIGVQVLYKLAYTSSCKRDMAAEDWHKKYATTFCTLAQSL